MGTLRPGPDERAGNNGTDGGDCPCQGPGDAEAWGELYREYAPAIFPVLQGVPCRRGEDAEDATMEIFMKLKDKLIQYERDAVVLGLALQGVSKSSLLGYAAAAQDSSRQGNRRSGKTCRWSILTLVKLDQLIEQRTS